MTGSTGSTGSNERPTRRADDAPPEEKRAGRHSATEQAAAILEDSDARQNDRNAAPDTVLERRRTEETVDPA